MVVLFLQLEANKASLSVKEYGISVTTMEDVFLKVASEQEQADAKPPVVGANSLGLEVSADQMAAPLQVQTLPFSDHGNVVIANRSGHIPASSASPSVSESALSWTCFGLADTLVRMGLETF